MALQMLNSNAAAKGVCQSAKLRYCFIALRMFNGNAAENLCYLLLEPIGCSIFANRQEMSTSCRENDGETNRLSLESIENRSSL